MSAANRFRLVAPWRLVLTALAATAVAGCQGGDRLATSALPMSVEARHPIQVGSERVVLDLPAERGGMGAAERGAARDFISAYRREGQGPLHVLGPRGAQNEGESQLVIGELRRLAYAGGVPASALSYSSYYSKDARPPVVLRYERYVAAAECGQWPSNLGTDWRNVPYENFGCASQRNLAAMVEDPRDLHGPRRMTPRDSERRDEIFDNYRRGQPTGARTGTDDAGTASDVGR